LLWANGSVAYAFSAEEPERLRGPQFEAAWADEFCIWPRPSETLAIPLAT
jgi:phage terminase large subunit-like protein